MTLRAHTILIGLRGSGKSTIGRLLARTLAIRFVDLDDRTPGVLGCRSVADAWQIHGEAAFRMAEIAALSSVLAEPACVIALGGGTPTAPGAADLLQRAKAAGASIWYLRADPATLAARLAGADNSQRPSLTGNPANSIEEITRVFNERDPGYRAITGKTLEVAGVPVDQVVRRLSSQIQED